MGGAAGTHRGVGWRGTSPGPPKGQEAPAPSAPRLCQLWGACGAASTSVLSSTPSQQPHQCQASASCWGFKQAQVPASGATTPGLLMDSSPCVHTHRGIPSPPAHVPGGQLRSRTPVHTRSPPGVGGGGGPEQERGSVCPSLARFPALLAQAGAAGRGDSPAVGHTRAWGTWHRAGFGHWPASKGPGRGDWERGGPGAQLDPGTSGQPAAVLIPLLPEHRCKGHRCHRGRVCGCAHTCACPEVSGVRV